MKFRRLSEVLENLEHTSSSNKMQEIAAKFFKRTSKKEIRMVAYFMLGEIAPAQADINLGMAEKMVIKAISRVTGKKEDVVKKVFRKKGDVGLAAEALVGKGRGLTLKKVFNELHRITKASGSGSQDFVARDP